MARYHITPDGNPGKCQASAGNCPFGATAPHFTSQDEARAAYEASMGESFANPHAAPEKLGSLDFASLELADRENQEILAMAASAKKPKRMPALAKKLGVVAATLVALSACSNGADYYEAEGVPAGGPAATATYEPEAQAPQGDEPTVSPQVESSMEKAKAGYNKAKAKYDSSYRDKVRDTIDEAKRYAKEYKPPSSDSSSGSTAGSEYDRAAFKHWSDLDNNNCDTRQDILQRDMKNIKLDSDGCTVLSGTLQDPYTGGPISYVKGNNSVDIDHVVPLSWAWRHGADSWTAKQREQFANDGSNLLAVQASANRSKGDKSPSEWMPINRDGACAYGESFLSMVQKYDLKIDQADISSVDQACG